VRTFLLHFSKAHNHAAAKKNDTMRAAEVPRQYWAASVRPDERQNRLLKRLREMNCRLYVCVSLCTFLFWLCWHNTKTENSANKSAFSGWLTDN